MLERKGRLHDPDVALLDKGCGHRLAREQAGGGHPERGSSGAGQEFPPATVDQKLVHAHP
jgi:hypothetical protein